jgi:hypothetical protein
MLIAHSFDLLPIWALFLLTILVMFGFIEYGFRLGRDAQANAKKAQTSQVRSIMGASLGLLAFILAFTFNTAQTHFEARTQNLAEEVRIARNAFRQSDLLAEPERYQAKQLLTDYIRLRQTITDVEHDRDTELIMRLIGESEKIQKQLWSIATLSGVQVEGAEMESYRSSLFTGSVLALTDIHYMRLHAALMNRIPFTIWATLYLMAILAMIVMGYQAGLTGRRSPIATMTLAFTFSLVMILITDLDRPIMSFFTIDDQLMVGMLQEMEAEMTLEYIPGD